MEPHIGFFEISAQVIPVLVLAVLVERRFAGEPGRAAPGLSTLLWLVVAEGIALRVAYRGDVVRGDELIVAGGPLLGAVAIVYPPARELFANMRRGRSPKEWIPDALFVFLSIGLLLVVLLAR